MALRTSDTVTKIAAAMLKVQKAIDTVAKEADNPYFKSKYADLSAVMGAVKGPLNDNDIVILQFPSETEVISAAGSDLLALTTRLQHTTSGEFYEATAVTPLSKSDPQAFGSAVTYLRRYTLQAVTGLLAEDDDGEAATGHAPRPQTQPKAEGSRPNPPARLNPEGVYNGQKLKLKPAGLPATTTKTAAPAKGRTGLFPKVDNQGEEGGEDNA